MLSDYQNREKKIPCLWNKSFIGMEQKFPLHETIISCRGNVSFFLFQTGCVQDMFDGFTQSGHILTSGCCKMRLTASATLYQFCRFFHQFAGIQAFSHQRFAQHNHQRAFLTVFDSSHEENLFLRIAFPLDLESQVLDGIHAGLATESDHFDTIALLRPVLS